MTKNIDPKTYDLRFWRLLFFSMVIIGIVMMVNAVVMFFLSENIYVAYFMMAAGGVIILIIFYGVKSAIDVMREQMINEIKSIYGEMPTLEPAEDLEDIPVEKLTG